MNVKIVEQIDNLEAVIDITEKQETKKSTTELRIQLKYIATLLYESNFGHSQRTEKEITKEGTEIKHLRRELMY